MNTMHPGTSLVAMAPRTSTHAWFGDFFVHFFFFLFLQFFFFVVAAEPI